MKAQQLILIGEALYGARFQTELAGDLSVGDRTMRRWCSGKGEIPDNVQAELAVVVAAKGKKLAKILAELTDIGV